MRPARKQLQKLVVPTVAVLPLTQLACPSFPLNAPYLSSSFLFFLPAPSSHLPNYPAMSLPTSSCFPICEKEPLAPSVVQPSSKPRPPPRPARTSTQDTSSPAHPDLNLNHSTLVLNLHFRYYGH